MHCWREYKLLQPMTQEYKDTQKTKIKISYAFFIPFLDINTQITRALIFMIHRVWGVTSNCTKIHFWQCSRAICGSRNSTLVGCMQRRLHWDYLFHPKNTSVSDICIPHSFHWLFSLIFGTIMVVLKNFLVLYLGITPRRPWSYHVTRIKPRSTVCKAITLASVLSQALYLNFY